MLMFGMWQPENDLFIEWYVHYSENKVPAKVHQRRTYCIDLDRLVFHVDRMPLFDLRNLPSESDFERFISLDFYSHRACDFDTPPEHRYKWKVPPPPVEESELAAFYAQPHSESARPVHEILCVSETIGEREEVRVQLLQVLVGNVLRGSSMGLMMTELETVSTEKDIPSEIQDLARDLVFFASGPMLMPRYSFLHDNHSDQSYLFSNGIHRLWTNLLLYVTVHLDDESNRKASISKLVAAAQEQFKSQGTLMRPEGPTYGIAVSMFHVVIVKIETNGSFQYSDALEFFPSSYATSPCTPGITALVRLGDARVTAEDVVHIARLYHTYPLENTKDFHPEPIPNDQIIHSVPVEIWNQITLHLPPIDLANLAICALTPQAVSACHHVLRYPHLGSMRLKRALPLTKFKRRTTKPENPYQSLHYASFVVDSPHGEILKVGPMVERDFLGRGEDDPRVEIAGLDVLSHSRWTPESEPSRAYPYGVVKGSTVQDYFEKLNNSPDEAEVEEVSKELPDGQLEFVWQ